jgi:hypothetical protein
MPSGTYHRPDLKHLFIVCTDACENGNHVLVSITSWTNDLCDGTTRLSKGDHPFVRKDSYMFYRGARIENAEVIQVGLDEGKFEFYEDPMSDEWVKKIMDGLCKSIHTPKKVKKYANCPEPTQPKKFEVIKH